MNQGLWGSLEAEKARRQMPPTNLRKKKSAADTLILAQWDPFQTSDLKNYKIKKSVCCFKSLSLWQFVTATIGNE